MYTVYIYKVYRCISYRICVNIKRDSEHKIALSTSL